MGSDQSSSSSSSGSGGCCAGGRTATQAGGVLKAERNFLEVVKQRRGGGAAAAAAGSDAAAGDDGNSTNNNSTERLARRHHQLARVYRGYASRSVFSSASMRRICKNFASLPASNRSGGGGSTSDAEVAEMMRICAGIETASTAAATATTTLSEQQFVEGMAQHVFCVGDCSDRDFERIMAVLMAMLTSNQNNLRARLFALVIIEVFDAFDADQDGKLSRPEFNMFFASLCGGAEQKNRAGDRMFRKMSSARNVVDVFGFTDEMTAMVFAEPDANSQYALVSSLATAAQSQYRQRMQMSVRLSGLWREVENT